MFQVKFFKSVKGEEYAYEFIKGLQQHIRERITANIQYLHDHGNLARRPYVEYLGNKVYELRTACAHLEIRILYFFDDRLIILTHGFLKKTDATPRNEIERAQKIRVDYFKQKD
ncbi:type II toxin-antitoxin system RelE/ParE family toxin [Candidatus Woesearchaeota archaeon]|nr:type II toxin-antitoxin system RelE/ParE family toxin [Candidatus Woesearchaeota archaeon]